MFFGFGPEVSYQVFSASGIVGDTSKPQSLYQIASKSGGSAGTVTLFDGTSSLGTVVYDMQGTINTTVFNNPGVGLVFPKGLYVSFDTNVTRVTVWARQVLS